MNHDNVMNFRNIQKYFAEKELQVTDYYISHDGTNEFHEVEFVFLVDTVKERFFDKNFFEDEVVTEQIYVQKTLQCKKTDNLIKAFEKAMDIFNDKPSNTSSILDNMISARSEELALTEAIKKLGDGGFLCK